jgi:hypothetical protein
LLILPLRAIEFLILILLSAQGTYGLFHWALRKKGRMNEPTTKLIDGEEIQFFLSLAGG